MRTTLDLPESLISEAMAVTNIKTKTELIKIALYNLIQKEKMIVSSKFQVVIPKEIRDMTGLQPGTQLEIRSCGTRIELVPMQRLKGIFPGLDTELAREAERI
jgi:AbrB family looped-hinge helix DNA binding protein